jgi:hypothetical protein
MEERGIREEEVLRALNGPDLSYQSYGKRVSEDVFEGGRAYTSGLRRHSRLQG